LGTIFSKKQLNRYQLRMSCAYLRLAKQRSGAARVGAKRHSGVGSLMSAGWSRRVKVKVKVVRLGKARFRWFLFLKICQKVPPRHQGDPRLIFPKNVNLPNQNISR
jgi:hypothetical protein